MIVNNIKIDINKQDYNIKNVVYKLTFPNNKIYIGQTTQYLRYRLSAHCRDIDGTLKSNAIQKYKEFKVEVLYQGDDLDNWEKIYIAKFKSIDYQFGYNLDSGGNLNKTHSTSTKEKIRLKSLGNQKRLGAILSDETKNKISISNSGKTRSKETKLKMSTIRQGKDNPRARSIIVIEITTGIETYFDYINEAANFYNVSRTTIGDVLNGRSKTFKKKQYIARYAE